MFMAEKLIRMGRGNDCDLRIADISVSRLHSVIFKEDKGFILEDCKSKFGTMVLLRHPVSIGGY
jgi:pSer/pThr/pTyr-binding forkhead associated (FHA) protein